MKIERFVINHLVKGEDLNHHGTLFAGRGAEWFVEAGFVSAANYLPAKYILCMKIHGMAFKKPVFPGEVIRFSSALVWTGKSRLISHVNATVKGQVAVEGFMTFVYVDDAGKTRPHQMRFEASNPEEEELQKQAQVLTY
ncbi:MAG: acyl-CoA thioesterase [Anaerolineaceae bacterium]|nr:acyl-CoA thioesterase [Anaerolineaceae bacterium]